MYIENKNYETNLLDAHTIRHILFTEYYSNRSFIDELSDLIKSNIQVINIDYDELRYSFTIRIKKTTMRKMQGFKQDSTFYYRIIPNIFYEFIKNHESDFINSLRNRGYEDPVKTINNLYENKNIMNTLCFITCISDNVIMIDL